MTPGGFYSGFLINAVRFGDAKALCLALLRAAKMHCAAISSAIEVQMAGQQGILHEYDWPALATVLRLAVPAADGRYLSSRVPCRLRSRNVANASA